MASKIPFNSSVQAIIDSLKAHVAIVNPNGIILLVNKAWERFSRENGGVSSKTSVGTNYFDSCAKAVQDGTREAFDVEKALRIALSPEGKESAPVEYPCHSPLENRWYSALCTPFQFEGRRYALVVHENVTIRHELSERVTNLTSRMSQEDRLAILGEWTAAIGHEIRNPLTVIQTRANLIQRKAIAWKTPSGKWVADHCEALNAMCQRIKSIVEGVMALTRHSDASKFAIESLKSIIEDAIFFVEARFRTAQITFIAPELENNLTIECQPAQLAEVILNVVNNACEAVAELPSLSERWIKISVQAQQKLITIIVENGGPPIPSKLQHRILGDSPFSLKLEGHGHGLGLRISKRLLRNIGGSMDIDPQAPHPRFLITLPRRQDHQASGAAA